MRAEPSSDSEKLRLSPAPSPGGTPVASVPWRRAEIAALAALVLLSAGLRAWASSGVTTPWIAPDELLYGLLGQGLYRHGSLTVLGGPTPYYSLLEPVVVGAPLSLANLALGYDLLKPLQALIMSLAALPAYAWARSLAARRYAMIAAALTVSVPGLAYAGLVMSEVVFYPVFVLAAWAAWRAVVAPTGRRQAVLLAACVLALATRIQAIVLLPVFASAVLVDAGLRRRRPRLAPFAPSAAVAALLVAGWLGWRLASGGSLLGGYSGVRGAYPLGTAAEFVGWHAGDVCLLCGVLPAAALLVLTARALQGSERDPAVLAYLAVAASTLVWLVIEVGVFASRQTGTLLERNVFVTAPVLFVGFALWLDRGAPGSLRLRTAAAFVAAAAVAAIPLGRFVDAAALPSAFSFAALYQLRERSSLATLEFAVGIGLVLAVALFAFARGRARLALPIVVLAVLGSASVATSHEIVEQSRAQQLRVVGPERRWIDRAAAGPTAYLYDGSTWWNAVWEAAFWNRDVRWVYDLPGTTVPGPIPQAPLTVSDDGELRPDGRRSPARYAVVPTYIALRGALVAQSPQVGTDRQGLGLWRVEAPLRISTITSGLFANGNIDVVASLAVYGCASGNFDLVLLVKQPQTVVVDLDGRRVGRKHFPFATTWDVHVPVAATSAGENRICRLIVQSDGLLGSTRFTFART